MSIYENPELLEVEMCLQINYGDKHEDKGFNKKIKRTISRFSR